MQNIALFALYQLQKVKYKATAESITTKKKTSMKIFTILCLKLAEKKVLNYPKT